MFDNFDLDDGDRDGDAAILDLFHQWQDAMRPLGGWPEDDDYADDALDRVIAIEDQIYTAPSVGVVGLGIKAFMAARANDLRGAADPCGLGVIEGEYGAPGGRLYESARSFKGLIADVVRLVPELAPLSAELIAAPERLLQLAPEPDEIAVDEASEHERTVGDDEEDPAVAIARRWAAAKALGDQVQADTEWACCKPGETARAARKRADAAVEVYSDIEDELADVTATTLAGLKVQLEYCDRISQGYSGLRVALCRSAAAGIEWMISGTYPPNAPLPMGELWKSPPIDIGRLWQMIELIEATLATDVDDACDLLPPQIEDLQVRTARRLVAGVTTIDLACIKTPDRRRGGIPRGIGGRPIPASSGQFPTL